MWSHHGLFNTDCILPCVVLACCRKDTTNTAREFRQLAQKRGLLNVLCPHSTALGSDDSGKPPHLSLHVTASSTLHLTCTYLYFRPSSGREPVGWPGRCSPSQRLGQESQPGRERFVRLRAWYVVQRTIAGWTLNRAFNILHGSYVCSCLLHQCPCFCCRHPQRWHAQT